MSTLSLRLPNSLHQAVKELAEEEHISLNQFITLAVAEKLSALVTVDYLKERGKRANKQDFTRILNQVSDEEPEDFDKL